MAEDKSGVNDDESTDIPVAPPIPEAVLKKTQLNAPPPPKSPPLPTPTDMPEALEIPEKSDGEELYAPVPEHKVSKGDSKADSSAPTIKQPFKASYLVPALTALILIIIGVALLAFSRSIAPELSKQEAFDNLVDRMLQISSVTNDISLDTEFLSFNERAQFDFSDPDLLKLRARSITAVSFLSELKVQMIAIGGDAYLMYESVEGLELEETEDQELEQFIGQWIKVSGEGVDQAVFEGSLNPSTLLMGINSYANGIMAGNLSEAELSEISQFIDQNPVYSYSGDIGEESIEGRISYSYDIDINLENLTAARQKMIDQGTSLEALGTDNQLDEINQIKFWIDANTGYLIKVAYIVNDPEVQPFTVESFYRDYNKPLNIQAPDDAIRAQDLEV